jgi:predicted RecA/RadA family phage recombinase
MATNYVQPGDVVTLAAPYDRTTGQGAQVGSIFGVALATVLSTVNGEFKTSGVWTLTKIGSQAWTQGQKIYWDNSNKRCTSVATDGILIGVATEAVAGGAGDVTGPVRLNSVAPDTSEGPQGAIASLTDSGGGTADGTVAAQAEPVTLTDSTGGSGTHDDTLADGLTVTDPAGLTGTALGDLTATQNTGWGASTEAGFDSISTKFDALVVDVADIHAKLLLAIDDLTVQNQNDSDLAQKVMELVTLAATQQDNMKEVTTKVEAILVALRAYGVIAA